MTTFIPSLTLPAAIFANPTASILLPVTLGTAVGFAVSPKKTQKTYMALKQPPFLSWDTLPTAHTPPDYPLSPPPKKHLLTKHGATLYTIQLGLNLIWTPLFFALKRPILATIDIVALTGTVSYLTYTWAQVDSVAAWALAPYLGWLGFATYLSAGVGYLNDWNLSDKEVEKSPEDKKTKYVDEKDE
ncbi:hypothetical protein EYC84_005115 [Monilinia fructicola]|uniref:TspO/MBR-related protein n=1 Tax=Monilinia fructicola TaxID=38448 RepID=A0A5M9JY12_MONFR|nr:hypothetical protein EYC84_005115 [Monilinia fructicola]